GEQIEAAGSEDGVPGIDIGAGSVAVPGRILYPEQTIAGGGAGRDLGLDERDLRHDAIGPVDGLELEADASGAGAEEAAVVAQRPQALGLLDGLLAPGFDVVGVEETVVIVVAAHGDPELPGGRVRD